MDCGCYFKHRKVSQNTEPPSISNVPQNIVDKANFDDPESCFILSKLLFENSTAYNPALGEHYLQKSVQAGFSDAILYYSEILHNGSKILKDDKKAEKYLKLAIKKDILTAPIQLSEFYFDSFKYKKGIKILKKSAKKNNTKSMIYLSQLYQEGNFIEQSNKKSFELLEKACNNGDQEAMYLFAEALRKGTICDQDLNRAAFLHKKNSENGNIDSIYLYAKMLEKGEGVEKDIEKAAQNFKLAADCEKSEAIIRYSEMLMNGEGVEKNINESYIYLNKAVEKGNPEALYKMGLKLINNNSLQNRNKAKEYFRKAALKNHVASEYYYGNILIQENKFDQAYSYLFMAANRGHKEASIKLGLMYLFGYKCPKNHRESYSIFKNYENENLSKIGLGIMYKNGFYIKKDEKKSSFYIPLIKCYSKDLILNHLKEFAKEQEDHYIRRQPCINDILEDAFYRVEDEVRFRSVASLANYGSMLYFGIGCEARPKDALPYIQEASECQNPEAMFIYGLIYQRGDVVEKNLKEAANLFNQSSKYGHVEATFYYAVSLMNGSGVDVDLQKAASYFKKAADFENLPSMYIYATLLEHGIGVPTNEKEAAKYYAKAAHKDHAESMAKYAMFCYEGKGIQKNVEDSFNWNKKAADLNNQIAIDNYLFQIIKKEGDGDINDAINQLNNRSSEGDSHATYLLGCCNEKGYFYDKDIQKSIEKYRIAATQKDEDAIYKMIELEEKSIIKEKISFYEDINNPLINYYCGKKYLEEEEEGNIEKGLQLIKKSSDECYPNSMIEYALILILGKFGVEKDPGKGFVLLEKAANLLPINDTILIDNSFESISFKTSVSFNMHLNYYDQDPYIQGPLDWIPVIGDTLFNALEQNIDSVKFITGKGNHTTSSNFSIIKQLVLLVTKRLGFESYINPTNDGQIECKINTYHNLEDEYLNCMIDKDFNNDFNDDADDNFIEIKKLYPSFPDICIEIVLANRNFEESKQFIEDFEKRLDIQKYIQRRQNNDRLINEKNLVNSFQNLYTFDKEVIEKVVGENEENEQIKKVLDRIKNEIPEKFLTDFTEIIMNFCFPINSLLDLMKTLDYDKSKILNELGEKSMIGHQKFLNLKKMTIYNRIKTAEINRNPKFTPIIEIDLRNAGKEKAERSIIRMMNNVRHESFWMIALLFSTNPHIQRCDLEEILVFVEQKAKENGFNNRRRPYVKTLKYLQMKEIEVTINNNNPI